MSRPRPADRAVIQISRHLHDRLTSAKKEREERLGRMVTFTEIIDEWRVRSEGLDLLAAHSKVVPSGT